MGYTEQSRDNSSQIIPSERLTTSLSHEFSENKPITEELLIKKELQLLLTEQLLQKGKIK